MIFLILIVRMILQCIIFLLSEVFLMVLMQSPERWNKTSKILHLALLVTHVKRNEKTGREYPKLKSSCTF